MTDPMIWFWVVAYFVGGVVCESLFCLWLEVKPIGWRYLIAWPLWIVLAVGYLLYLQLIVWRSDWKRGKDAGRKSTTLPGNWTSNR